MDSNSERNNLETLYCSERERLKIVFKEDVVYLREVIEIMNHINLLKELLEDETITN